MKKLFTLVIMALCTLTSYAQLKVDSLGCTTIGVENTNYGSKDILKVTGKGATGIESMLSSSQSKATAIKAKATSTGSLAVGMSATAYGAGVNIGVEGSVMQVLSTVDKPISGGAAISGTTGAPITQINGYYAGYFKGDVKVTGTVSGTILSGASSTSSIGENTSLCDVGSNRISVTDRLQQVDLLQMERVNQDGSLAANKAESDKANTVQTKLSSVSYSLAADQLKEVYPELVYEDGEGNYSINYVEMVPLLVQSIKELSAKVTILEAELGLQDSTKPELKTKRKTENADDVTLYLPDKANEAILNVYDLSGKLLRTVSVSGTCGIELSSYTHGLPIGTYVYNLIVNGKKQKARKVIVR